MALTASGLGGGYRRESLVKQIRGGASWFFWIAAMTLVNTVMLRTGSTTSFLIGLTITQVIDVMSVQLGSTGAFITGLFDFVCLGFFVLLGLKALRAKRWAFVTGIVLYALDTLLSLAAANVVSIGFHFWALFSMGVGLRQSGKLRALDAEAALPPVLGAVPLPSADGPVDAQTLDQAAANMEEMARRLYAPSQRYAAADPKNFRGLDLNFYDTSLQKLQALGFRRLADEENLDLKGTAQDPGCFVRVALGGEGTIMVALFQMRPKVWLRVVLRLTGNKLGKAIDFETEFSDGSFLCTGNAQLAAAIKRPPEISSLFLPWETTLEKLHETHLQRIKEHLVGRPQAVPLVFHTLDEVHASQNRQQAIKAVFRKNIGGMSREELLARADTPEKVQVAEQLWQRLQERKSVSVAVAPPA